VGTKRPQSTFCKGWHVRCSIEVLTKKGIFNGLEWGWLHAA